jgi:hypothetical protein
LQALKKRIGHSWKESRLECLTTLSGYLNIGWTLFEQQRELRSKCGEMEKAVEGEISE